MYLAASGCDRGLIGSMHVAYGMPTTHPLVHYLAFLSLVEARRLGTCMPAEQAARLGQAPGNGHSLRGLSVCALTCLLGMNAKAEVLKSASCR